MSRRFTIGREKQCDVAVFDDSVSRLHAEIWLADDGSLMMSDCGSVNGTTVVRGQQRFPLRQDVMLPGDQVRMGGVMLSVQDMVEAIEAKNPGALTPRGAAPAPPPVAAFPLPPPPPQYQPQYQAPYQPPQQFPQQSPQQFPQQPPPPPPPAVHSAPAQGGRLIRCECGAIKTQGQICPGCHR